MKVLWHSVAPFTPSGYGQQTAIFAPRIRDLGHEVILSTWYGLNGSQLEYEGLQLLPGDQKYGNVLLPAYAELHKPDVVIALMDAWPLNPQRMAALPLAVWVPVDHMPCPPRVVDFFKLSGARPIAMSRFGEQMLREAGLDPLYVPHGIDTKVFKPDHRERVRADLKIDDRFVVGVVAANTGGTGPTGINRKAFPEMLFAFKNFQLDHPDALLYLHTHMTGRPGLEWGLDLWKLIRQFEIEPESVKYVDQVTYETGMATDTMAALYSAFDVLLNPSYGEGFGIPIIEAQSCGTPVIVNNWTSMPELCGSGWLVEGEPWYDTREGAGDAFFKAPAIGSIIEQLEHAYEARGDQSYRDRAREFALDYDADKVLHEFWVPTLEALSRPREVAPLHRNGNRAQRRAASRQTVSA